jgi:hypothetical protein
MPLAGAVSPKHAAAKAVVHNDVRVIRDQIKEWFRALRFNDSYFLRSNLQN